MLFANTFFTLLRYCEQLNYRVLNLQLTFVKDSSELIVYQDGCNIDSMVDPAFEFSLDGWILLESMYLLIVGSREKLATCRNVLLIAFLCLFAFTAVLLVPKRPCWIF